MADEHHGNRVDRGGRANHPGRRDPADPGDGRHGRRAATFRATQLSATDAMRAREVAVPSPADLAAAAADLVLIRRNYLPPDDDSRPTR